MFCLFVCFCFWFFFHIQEGTILFMWVERQGVQKVNSTCIWKRNNKEGWQTVARKMWVSEFLLSLYNGSSSFVFLCLFLPLSNNLLASRSQTFRHHLDFTICHPFNVKDILIKFDLVVAFKAPPLCNEFEQWELKTFHRNLC